MDYHTAQINKAHTPRDIAAAVIEAAEQYEGSGLMKSSAQLCLSDSRLLYRLERYHSATRRSLKSLAYSIGIMHDTYQAADVAFRLIPEPE